MPGFYKVVIEKIEGSAPFDGFIDNKRIVSYRDGMGGGEPTDIGKSLAKTRANSRYEQLNLDLSKNTNFKILEINRPDADANTPPTTFEMTLQYDRLDYLYQKDNLGNDLNHSESIQWWIAESLIHDIKITAVVWNPELNDLNLPIGETVMEVEVGKLGNSITELLPYITVTPIASTSTPL